MPHPGHPLLDAQYAFPNEDPFGVPQGWMKEPGSGDIWDKIDEQPFDAHDGDTTSIFLDGPNFETCQVELEGTLADPGIHVDHAVHVWAKIVDPITGAKLRIELRQGPNIVIAFRDVTSMSSVYLRFPLVLTPAEAATITNYGDLQVRLTGSSFNHLGQIRVTQVYLEIPAAELRMKPSPGVIEVNPQPLVVDFGTKPLFPETPTIDIVPQPPTVEVPKTVLPSAAGITIDPQALSLDLGTKTLTPFLPIIDIVPQPPTVDLGTKTLPQSAPIIDIVPQPPGLSFPRILTPDVITILIAPQAPVVFQDIRLSPGAKGIDIEPQAPLIDLGNLSIGPGAGRIEFAPQPIGIELDGLVAPNAGDLEIVPQAPTVNLGAKILVPGAPEIDIVPQPVSVETPDTFFPAPGVILIVPQPVRVDMITLTPDPITIVITPLGIEKISIPKTTPPVLIEARPRQEKLHPRRQQPSLILTPVFRTRFLHDARGLYRVYNPVEYRFRRRDGAPPELLDVPYATSATLPATPSTTFPNGDWFVGVTLFNGVIDSGFLPLGLNGEPFIRLRVTAGLEAPLPPLGPTNWWLRVLAGGVVEVEAVYLDLNTALRADKWAIAFTTDGSDPLPDAPDATVTIPSGQAVMLRHALPAQSDGTTVKVRLQTQREGSTIYSEGSYVLAALADAVGEVVGQGIDRWTGRLPENFTG